MSTLLWYNYSKSAQKPPGFAPPQTLGNWLFPPHTPGDWLFPLPRQGTVAVSPTAPRDCRRFHYCAVGLSPFPYCAVELSPLPLLRRGTVAASPTAPWNCRRFPYCAEELSLLPLLRQGTVAVSPTVPRAAGNCDLPEMKCDFVCGMLELAGTCK